MGLGWWGWLLAVLAARPARSVGLVFRLAAGRVRLLAWLCGAFALFEVRVFSADLRAGRFGVALARRFVFDFGHALFVVGALRGCDGFRFRGVVCVNGFLSHGFLSEEVEPFQTVASASSAMGSL